MSSNPAAAPSVSPFLTALKGGRPARKPIWIMRQAGRYLPEYMAIREKAAFLDVCRTPELACEVTLQPLRRFGMDAAILFSDILLPLGPMGADFVFADKGPQLTRPVRHEDDVAALQIYEPAEKMACVAQAIRMIKNEIPQTPLIGFAGAPLTLTAYLVEGGGSRNFRHLKTMLFARPDLAETLLDTITDQVIRHLQLQIDAGVDAVQVFDTWAGILSPHDYTRFVLPRIKRIMSATADTGIPRILFTKGGTPFLDLLPQTGADAISLDWTMDITESRRCLGRLPVQGNLDPLVLFGSPAEIRERAIAVCRAGDEIGGHVFNLGHGILPQTPIDAVETLVTTVHEYRSEDR